MTIRALFNIILKVIGILFIRDILAALPAFYSLLNVSPGPNLWQAAFSVAEIFIFFFPYVLVFYLLVFKTNFVIDILKIDKGFDQEIIPLNVHRSTILSISIIVIGGLMVAHGIPDLCRQLVAFLQLKTMPDNQIRRNISSSIVPSSILDAVKIIIGSILMNSQRQIVALIERQRKQD